MKKLIVFVFVFLFSVSLNAQIQIRNSEADSKQPVIQKLQGGIILNLKQKQVPMKVDSKWHYVWEFKQLWIAPNTSWTDVKEVIKDNLNMNAFELNKIKIKYQKKVKYDPYKMPLKTDKDIRRAIRRLNKRLRALEGK